MKKLLSFALVLVLVLSLGAAAYAADNQDASFNVTYKLANDGTSSPAETFTFTFTNGQVTDAAAGVNAPAIPASTVSFDAGEATAAGVTKIVPVNLAGVDWPSVGIYTYDVKQTAGTTAGVSYDTKTLKMKVTVALDNDNEYYVAFVTTSLADVNPDDGRTDVKTGGFENTYSAGDLSVTKNVEGNMGDKTKFFDIKVTVTNPDDGKTYPASYNVTGGSAPSNPDTITAGTQTTFKLKDDETITIANLPQDVTYTVTEADYKAEGYETTYQNENGTIAAADVAATVTNTKGITVDTGISLDSLPYIVLLVVSMSALAFFAMRKRAARER